MKDASDPFKAYNEKIKTLEALAKRESELVQKLSQADSDKDIEAKVRWATELKEVVEKVKTLQKKRSKWIKSL